jgi:sugar phosphate isomerase/epimerase
MNRRQLLSGLLGSAIAAPIFASCSRQAEAFGQVERRFRIGYSAYPWGAGGIAEGIEVVSRFGFEGIEPFPSQVGEYYLRNPLELKERLDAAGIELVTCSGGGPATTGNFIDPAAVRETIDSHFSLARDFIQHFGCTHFKFNLGGRPEGGPTDAQLGTMADALNELDRRTADLGIRTAPHPHIWSPLERPEEIALVAERTDPEFVYFTADTAHLQLGGTDPVQFMRDYYSRVAAMHWKDAPFRYRHHTGPTPTREEHQENNLYTGMGTGGVDFPAIVRLLNERDFDEWITMDYDPPRPHEGTIEQQLTHNRWYLTDILGFTFDS